MHELSTNMYTDTLQGVSTDPEKLGPKAAVVNGKNVLQLLNHCNGSFRPGILTALVGSSGAGKTTLMDVLAGRKTSKPTCALPYLELCLPCTTLCLFLHHIVPFLHEIVPVLHQAVPVPASDCAAEHCLQDMICDTAIDRVCVTKEQSFACYELVPLYTCMCRYLRYAFTRFMDPAAVRHGCAHILLASKCMSCPVHRLMIMIMILPNHCS